MKSVFVENGSSTQKIYDSLLVEPADLSIFSNGLAMKMITELGKKPLCAMDLAKKLGQREQKVYYHLRKMKDAGIIRLERSEPRYGMTAKIYALVSPVISAKLHEDFYTRATTVNNFDPKVREFFKPFIKDGKLNTTIIFGDVRPHGKYEGSAHDGAFITDFMLMLGKFVDELEFPSFKLDSRVDAKDLKGNLIIIGNPKVNTVAQLVNEKLPLKFNTKTWSVMSTLSNKVYDDDFIGLVIKCENPFNKKNKLLFIGGKRSRGTIAANIALTRHIEEIMSGNVNDERQIAKIIKGVDKDSDGFIDHVHFLE